MVFRGSITMTLAAPVLLALAVTSVAAQGITGPGSVGRGPERSRLRTALYGAALGGALAATPVVLTSREPEEDVGIAILLGLASGGVTGAMLPLPAGTRRIAWKGGLIGLATGSLAGGLTLVLAWNDRSIEFETPGKLAVGAAAGGALGLIVGGVLGRASGEQEKRSRALPSPRIGLFLSPSLSDPGRWTGAVSVPLF